MQRRSFASAGRRSASSGRTVHGLIVAAALLGLGLAGCSPRMVKQSWELTQAPGGVVGTTRAWQDSTGAQTIKGFEVTCPGNVEVAAFDSSAHALVAGFTRDGSADWASREKKNSKEKQREYFMYQASDNTVPWAAKSTAKGIFYNHLTQGCLSLGGNLYRAATGELMRPAEGSLFWTKGGLLQLGSTKYKRLDAATGAVQWTRPGSSCTGYRWESVDGDWVFVVADGLHAMRVTDGKGWDAEVDTYHKDTGKALAANVAIGAAAGCLAGLSGSSVTSTPTVSTPVHHNCTSLPVVVADRVYLAARSRLYCFQKETGAVLWKAKLPRDFGPMLLASFGGKIAVASEGWEYTDYTIQQDRTPEVALYDSANGAQLATLALPEPAVVTSFHMTADGALLLTANRLYRLGPDLAVVASRDVAESDGLFLRFLSTSADTVVIRTTRGALAINPATMATLWSIGYGTQPLTTAPASDWVGANSVYSVGRERRLSHTVEGRPWLATAEGHLLIVDVHDQGRPILDIDLGNREIEFTPGAVVARRTNSVLVIPYQAVGMIESAPQDAEQGTQP